MTGPRTLVAGIGNVFLTDDGFGVEVVRRIDPADLPPDTDVADFGIRGLHLAYELLDDRYDTAVLIDAVPLQGAKPGTLAVLDVDLDAVRPAADGGPGFDAHGMTPDAVLGLLRGLGGSLGRVFVVGCRPAVLAEGMGLSDDVAAVVDDAVRLVLDLVHDRAEMRDGDRTQTPVGAERRHRT